MNSAELSITVICKLQTETLDWSELAGKYNEYYAGKHPEQDEI